MQNAKEFESFTNVYQVQKTLRFGLKPMWNTLEKMREQFEYDKDLQTFLTDQRIEDAYQSLKPFIDDQHELFINMALKSGIAKQIPFADYIAQRASFKNSEKIKNDLDKALNGTLDRLRGAFDDVFFEAGENWKKEYSKFDWKKGSNVAKGADVLSSQDLLEVIRELPKKDEEIQESVERSLNEFKGFFTYLGGFNQNRANYYSTKEKATAIATRTVNENLPRFADNVFSFEERKEEYLEAYQELKKAGKAIVAKDGRGLEDVEVRIFDHEYFKDCLTQEEIDRYNLLIGDANFIVNLYNQYRGNSATPLKQFKALYKQIGCGKRNALYFKLDFEKNVDAEKESVSKGRDCYSVEGLLDLARRTGDVFFSSRGGDDIDCIPKFVDYVVQRKEYEGFYLSKIALNTISSKYFANWDDLVNLLLAGGVFKKGGKSDEEDVKIPEIIHLLDLFTVIDTVPEWRTSLFKKGVVENERTGKRNKEIVSISESAHEALLRMITEDIRGKADDFLRLSTTVAESTKEYFAILDSDARKSNARKEWKENIKKWMDCALDVSRMLKYFKVRESKVTGVGVDATLSQALDVLLFGTEEYPIDWFGWYDALRNYLTQEPQDRVKENKLKLNFKNGSLLNGWSDGQEKIKASVLLKKGEKYYLGILKKKSIFCTKSENNPIYENITKECGRLILANLSFKTLAGMGFLGEFGVKYGDMGKQDPLRAILCLKKIIRDRYLKKYPSFQTLIEEDFLDKKTFDKRVQEVLKDVYSCRFRGVDWDVVRKCVECGDMFLFEIYSKDFNQKSTGRKNQQTSYWESLFLEGSPHQLSGKGEIFYRKQAISDIKIKEGYEAKPWVVSMKRFTDSVGAFTFHCSVTLNYASSLKEDPKFTCPVLNKVVCANVSNSPDVHFLGIDRGEKHLAYYSLYNAKEKRIVSQGSLNVPFMDSNGKPRVIQTKKRTMKDEKEFEETVECRDYNELLEVRSGDRDYARKNWQTIGTIKELKQGYLSQVVHKIAKLAVFDAEHPTYVVLENLNVGFMRGRQKIEKSVYKQFEAALAKKFGFLVDKEKDGKFDELGSVTRAFQLAPSVKNFEELKERGGQVGMLLFTRPDYTSQTDPVSGWRKHKQIRIGSKVKEDILKAFSDIGFDGKDYFFKYVDPVTKKSWCLWSGQNGVSLDRYYRERNTYGVWEAKPQSVADMLDGLFARFDKTKSLYEQIKQDVVLQKINEHSAWEALRFVVNLIQQIRNSDGSTGRGGDFILSPVRENGVHFDSRVYWDVEQWESGVMLGKPALLPSSGDATGAYNIARKGVIMNEHIKRNLKPYIRDEEWDAWLAGEEVWDGWLQENLSLLKKSKR